VQLISWGRALKIFAIPRRYEADQFSLSWNQENEITTVAFLMRSNIWRFQLQDKTSR
jgi:hypothetical protein